MSTVCRPTVFILLVVLGWGLLLAEEPSSERESDIAPVWSGHPVGFALLTRGKQQLVAFYDADRRMTIGARALDESPWELVRLPAVLGWDSHNYVTLAVDRAGQIHVSGNRPSSTTPGGKPAAGESTRSPTGTTAGSSRAAARCGSRSASGRSLQARTVRSRRPGSM